MKKRRKLRLFPVISLVVVVLLLIYAVKLISGIFVKEEEDTDDDIVIVNPDEIETETPDPVIPPEEPEMPDEPEIPVEDTTTFEEDAPKPVFTHAELVSMYGDTILGENEGDDFYISDIIFIGDSTTHGMAYYGVLEGGKETTQVWTPKSGTLAMWNLLSEKIVYPDDDSEMLIPDAIGITQPVRVVLTLGVNGVSSLSENDFKGYYKALIEKIKEKAPECEIILQSIYPVCDYYEVKSISMEKINRANSWIADLAHEEGVYYLNTITALVNEKGYLNPDFCNGDGIHISREGFSVILDYIKSHAVK